MTTTSLAAVAPRLAASSAAGLSDQRLLDQFVQRRDQAAFAALVARYGGLVLAACRRVLSNEHDAEDAFQATFLVLARDAGKVRHGEALSTWLYGTARRVSLRALRDDARRRRREQATRTASAAEPEADLQWREVQAALDAEVERLPEIYRSVFLLCCREGLSLAQAGQRLGLKGGTVCSRLAAARRRLRERLSGRGVELASAVVPPRLVELALEARVGNAPEAVVALACGSGAASLKWVVAAVVAVALGAFGVAGSAAKTEPPRAASPPAAKEAAKAEVAGKVVDADGKPVAGASLFLTQTPASDGKPRPLGKTDSEGRFSAALTPGERDRLGELVATAEGHGPDWVSMDGVSGPVTLRLAKDDVPVRGRIVDLEGRPVAGVKVSVGSLAKGSPGAMASLLHDLARPGADPWPPSRLRLTTLPTPPGLTGAVTGKDGRFRLTAVGRDRVVDLTLDGADLARAHLQVFTRAGESKGLARGTYLASFTHAAEPGRAARGVVKDRATGKPVAGLLVVAQTVQGGRFSAGSFGKTDAEGKFRLTGLPKGTSYHVSAGGGPYIRARRELADTPGLTPLDVSLEVERALELRVRVVDKATGKPVRAQVQYAIRQTNRQIDRYPSYQRNAVGWSVNDADGWHRETVIPGPAVVAVQAVSGEYTRAVFDDRHSDGTIVGGVIPTPLWLPLFHAMVAVNPDEKDPKTCEVVVRLDPGRSVRGRVVGPDGKPLDGVLISGRTAVWKAQEPGETPRLETSEFTISGLDPARPRMVVFYHDKRKLARAVTVRGDEKGPLTVQLEPLAAMTGALVDAADKPLAEAEVRPGPARKLHKALPGDLVLGGEGSLRSKLNPTAKTGRDGAFRVEGLIVGMRYDLSARPEKGAPSTLVSDLEALPNKAMDVGKVKLAKPRR